MSTQRSSSNIDWEYTCTNCRRGFNASMAHQITVVNENEAELMCSWCKHTDTYHAPVSEVIERPPAIVGHTILEDKTEQDSTGSQTQSGEGLSTARVFFEGGAWLQYRKASDGWVYEEMFDVGGEKIASFKAEFEKEACDSPQEYLHRMMEQYDKYTVRGLGIQLPHIAAVLL